MNLSRTWKAYFTNQLVIKPSLTNNFAKYADSIEGAPIEKLNELAAHSAFRCFAHVKSPSANEMTPTIQLCHHYAVLDDMLGWGKPSHLYHVALHGFDAKSSPMILNKDKPPTGFRFDMPKQKALLRTATSQEHLLELKDEAESELNVIIPNLVQVPPFLFATLIELSESSPLETFFHCARGHWSACKQEGSNGTKSEKTACINEVWDSAFYFLQFLWAAVAHPDELTILFEPPPVQTLPVFWADSQDSRLSANLAITHPSDRNPLPSTLPNLVAGLDQATTLLVLAASSLAARTDRLVDSRLTTTATTHCIKILGETTSLCLHYANTGVLASVRER